MAPIPQSSAYDDWIDSFGLNPETDGAPAADPDGDRFPNETEFAFGSNPTESTASLFEFRNENDQLIVTFLALDSGATYHVETNPDLSANPGWLPEPAIQIASAPNEPEPPFGYSRHQISIDLSAAPARNFFRLRAALSDQ